MESLQNFTQYEPTEKEKCLLDILLNPENRMKNVTEICKLAKCTRPVYYDAFAKPEFVEIYKQKSIDLVKQCVAPLINTFIREAQRGSFQHGKVLLEMSEVFTDKLSIEGSVKLDVQSKLASILEQLEPSDEK